MIDGFLVNILGIWILWLVVKYSFPFKFSSEFKIGFYTFLWNNFAFKVFLLLVVLFLVLVFFTVGIILL